MEKVEINVQNTEYFQTNGNMLSSSFLIDAPYMTKYDIQKYQDEMILSSCRSASRGSFLKIRSSGSSGKIVEVLWDKNDYISSNLCLWRLRKKYYYISISDFYLTFHSLIYSGSQVRDINETSVVKQNNYLSISKLSVTESNVEKIINYLFNHPIKWILTQPSMLLILMKLLKQKKMEAKTVFPQLQYIELNGEMVFDSEKRMFEGYFNVPIANLYGASEVNGIAFQCPKGHLHIIDKNVKVQLFNYKVHNKNTFEGDVAVTSLQNKLMPIISYAIGDRITIKLNEICEYSNAPVINVLIGRTNDCIESMNDTSLSSYQLSYCVERVNTEVGNPILEYKFVCHNNKQTLVLYIKQDFCGWEKEISKRLDAHLKETCHIKCVDFRFVYDPIQLSETGKVRNIEID